MWDSCRRSRQQAMAAMPVVLGVHANSIIPGGGDGPIESGDDGVVKYESAHLDGVESEYIARSGHSTQSKPYTIEEVRRILMRHAADACTRDRLRQSAGAAAQTDRNELAVTQSPIAHSGTLAATAAGGRTSRAALPPQIFLSPSSPALRLAVVNARGTAPCHRSLPICRGGGPIAAAEPAD
jgi:hypothetical protein